MEALPVDDTAPTLIPLPDAARSLGRHEVTLRRDAVAGTIPAIKVGSRWYVNSKVLGAILSGDLDVATRSRTQE